MSDEDEDVVHLPANYVFCPYCGHPSHYSLDGYISPLEFEL